MTALIGNGSYRKNLDKISDPAVLGVNPRHDSLQVRQTFSNLRKLSFKGWVVQEVLYSIQSSKSPISPSNISEDMKLPSVDVRNLAKRHA
jgi:hypothetical protein